MALSVLLVDDSKFVRKAMRKELDSIFKGKEVEYNEAGNGNEALELIFNEPYDLVLLDLTMPEKTGYDVLETLKEKGVRKNIVVLTADIQPEAEKVVRGLGAIGYMRKVKPFDRPAFEKILRGINLI